MHVVCRAVWPRSRFPRGDVSSKDSQIDETTRVIKLIYRHERQLPVGRVGMETHVIGSPQANFRNLAAHGDIHGCDGNRKMDDVSNSDRC